MISNYKYRIKVFGLLLLMLTIIFLMIILLLKQPITNACVIAYILFVLLFALIAFFVMGPKYEELDEFERSIKAELKTNQEYKKAVKKLRILQLSFFVLSLSLLVLWVKSLGKSLIILLLLPLSIPGIFLANYAIECKSKSMTSEESEKYRKLNEEAFTESAKRLRICIGIAGAVAILIAVILYCLK